MDISDPHTTHHSSPDMSSDEDSTEWDAPATEPMQGTLSTSTPQSHLHPQPQPGPGPTLAYSSLQGLSSTSSSSSLNPSGSLSGSKRKKGESSSSSKKDKETAKGLGTWTRMTPKMKDRQARGKDWDMSTTDEDDSDLGFRKHYLNPDYEFTSANTYEAQQRRRNAGIMLDNPELLMMYASARNDSIPSTRLHFTKVLCGYEEAENTWPFEKSYGREEAADRKYREDRKPQHTFWDGGVGTFGG